MVTDVRDCDDDDNDDDDGDDDDDDDDDDCDYDNDGVAIFMYIRTNRCPSIVFFFEEGVQGRSALSPNP